MNRKDKTSLNKKDKNIPPADNFGKVVEWFPDDGDVAEVEDRERLRKIQDIHRDEEMESNP